MKLSILIPVYNEINTITELVELVKNIPISKEIILVDDCSTDGSKALIQNKYSAAYPDIKLIYHSRNMGKGTAIRTALDNATGEYSIIQDADLEYNPKDYIVMLDSAREKNSAVIYGSRFLKTWRVTSIWHFLVNRFLTIITNILFGSHLTDMETCYKLIKTDIFKSLKLESSRFDIEVEITAKLLKRGINIIEIPISYKGRSFHEGKKITWKDGIVTLWSLFKYRLLA